MSRIDQILMDLDIGLITQPEAFELIANIKKEEEKDEAVSNHDRSE